MNSGVEKRFKEALSKAVSSNQNQSVSQMAQSFIEDQQPLVNEWVFTKITDKIKKLQAGEPVWRAKEMQMYLPGFRSLNDPIPTAEGTMPLANATITDLRECLKVRKSKLRDQLKPLENLIREMEPFARKNRTLCVAEYYELRVAGAQEEIA